MSKNRQWRCVYRHHSGSGSGVCFIDADTEVGAREFFAKAYPGVPLIAITPEEVDPCARYERRP